MRQDAAEPHTESSNWPVTGEKPRAHGHNPAVRSITLDTSCALNFLGVDQDADAALSDIVGAAMAGRVSVRVSARAFEEVASLDDERAREQRLLRLRAFGRIEVASHQVAARDRLAIELHEALFPNAEAGSRTDEHNHRDCLQIATHAITGRSAFCTLDGKLLKRAGRVAQRGIRILSPARVLHEIEEGQRAGALPGPSTIAVRDAVPDQDEAAIREVLEPLAADYPAFSEWLTGKLAAPTTRVRVGLLQERVGAVALSAPKDGTGRVVKLSAFYVADFAQDQGLGANLLWAELRTWAKHGVEKVYVTVSSRHPELVEFLHGFGFLIEGVSARRYQDDTAEIVLAKHFVRRVVSSDGLQHFADVEARAVFAAPRSVGASASTWAMSPRAPHPSFAWEGKGATTELVATESDVCVRRWDLLALERIFHPTRFPLPGGRRFSFPSSQHGQTQCWSTHISNRACSTVSRPTSCSCAPTTRTTATRRRSMPCAPVRRFSSSCRVAAGSSARHA